MKRSLACSLSVNLNWALSAVSPATSVISTPSGTSTLNQMKSVLISTAGFSAPPPPPLPVAPPLPPQPTRATAAKRLMQRARIAKAFFFMVVSSSICNRPWITCLYCTRGRLVQVGHVSHSGGLICADKWQYARARMRVEPCMPQFALLGSLERWAICPMFTCAGLPQGGPGAGQACGLVDAPNVAQQRCRLKVLDLAVTKAKPRKVERCSVKNADSKCLMDRRFARTVGPRWRVAPRRHLQALILPLPRA